MLRGKPAPDIYLTAAERLGVDPSDCLVFEDIVPGIQAGLAAGMEVCAVDDEHSAFQEEEKRELAQYYIEDYVGLFL
jgi:16S rRNA pseudouridine516 synthase